MSFRGPRGAKFFPGAHYIEDITNEVERIFLVRREDIIFGLDKNPPLETPCRVYVLFGGGAVEYLYKQGSGWVNWNYLE